MAEELNGKTVAILAADGFEQSELFEPKKALEAAGAKTHIVSLQSGEIKGWDEKDWGDSIAVDLTVDTAQASDYDALMLPGGVMNPDKLRINDAARRVCESVFRGWKTGRRNLSRAVDFDFRRCGRRPQRDFVAVVARRFGKRRRQLERSRSGVRSGFGHQPQTGGFARLQRQAD